MAAVLSSGCGLNKPIKLGFAGELSGSQSDLGVAGRNGVQLAVETINASGGVAGHAIELLVVDDKGTPEGAQEADRKLVDAGVVAIIGHMTSEQSMAGLVVANEANVVLFSPTTSTPKLNGLSDYFFRINPVNSKEAQLLARYVFETDGLSRMTIVFDTDNEAFSLPYDEVFREAYQDLGGKVVGEVGFSSATLPGYDTLVQQAEASSPQGLLIIASAFDTAMISQQTRLLDWYVPLYSSGWAQTEALIQNGGQAVEGIKIVGSYELNSQSPAFLDFQARYQERFGREPTFAATQSYEAVLILTAALEKTRGKKAGLRAALLETREFEGLTGRISLDEYGDAVRTQFLITIKDGQFVRYVALEPAVP